MSLTNLVPLVSVIILASRGEEALGAALQSIRASDYPSLEVVVLFNGVSASLQADRWPDLALVTASSPENLGVAGGRNHAAERAKGALLLFLDDDAVLLPTSIGFASAPFSDNSVGAVAFSIRTPDSGEPALWTYPWPVTQWSNQTFEAPWFIGCGNLIRASAFFSLGGFWEGYYREMEEIDFSWRLLDAGWRLVYEPAAIVQHPERTASHIRFSIYSNLALIWRLLPLGLAARQTLLKCSRWAMRSALAEDRRDALRGLVDFMRSVPRVRADRSPLKTATVDYLRAVHGQGRLGLRLQWRLRGGVSATRNSAPPTQH